MCLNMVKKSFHEIIFHFSGMGFSTNDQDNDPDSSRHRSQHFKGAWQYASCHHSNLNGLYLNGSHVSYADGVKWLSFRGHRYSLKRTEMKVRPKAQDNVHPRVECQSNRDFNIPQATLEHLTVVLSKGWGTLTLPGWGVQVLPVEYTCFIFQYGAF